MRPDRAAACAAMLLTVGIAGAQTLFIEIAEGPPDGADTGGAAIGSTSTLSVWIWTDTPGLELRSVGFDIVGRTLGASGVDPAAVTFGSAGTVDPLGLFGGLGSAGPAQPGLIPDIALGLPFLPGPMVPTDRAQALLVLEGLEMTPLVFTGGAFIESASAASVPGPARVETFGWYQTPTPGATVALLGAGALGARRRR